MNKNNIHNAITKVRRDIASKSLSAFAHVYLKDYLKFKLSAAHENLFTLADDLSKNRSRHIVVAAPRRFGKTTVFGTIYMLYCLCFAKEKFILVCSNTAQQAQEKIDNVRKILCENTAIIEDFPGLYLSNKKMRSWTKDEIVSANGVKIKAFGFQQRVRGVRHGASRPSLVLIDDLDSENHTTNIQQKDKVKNWFLGSLLKIGDEATNYILVGNVFHRYSVIGDLCSDQEHRDWEKHIYRAVMNFPKHMDLWDQCWQTYYCLEKLEGMGGADAARQFYSKNKQKMDEGAVLLWPERDDLFNLMMDYHTDPLSFNAEMQNKPREAVRECFNLSSFQFWTKIYKNEDEIMKFLKDGGALFAACDPSLGKKGIRGDRSGIVIVGVKDSVFYVLHADIRKRSIDELIDDIFAYCGRYTFQDFVIETNGGQELFYKMLSEKTPKTSVFMRFSKTNSTGDKKVRIETMAPMIRTGQLKLSQYHLDLLDEFASFPYGRYDDGLDALEMAIALAKKWSPGKLEIQATDIKDVLPNGDPFCSGIDLSDREFLSPFEDDGPSPNAKEIKGL